MTSSPILTTWLAVVSYYRQRRAMCRWLVHQRY